MLPIYGPMSTLYTVVHRSDWQRDSSSDLKQVSITTSTVEAKKIEGTKLKCV